MFLKHRNNGDMVDVSDISDLTNLFHQRVSGRYQAGEELQDPEEFNKADLVFLSGEELPRCWLDPDYRSQK
ncbi:acetyltransferase [Thalassotalea nanhaiensis]|uniref:Acetyltransferase n=1 Tax=Thalassotalea nanhaiensis TaxID=3065648 RepID=A0ABY9TKV3_9GAMM|nr:acetyltransferase [Colwelliaceae bacterium SQ345]